MHKLFYIPIFILALALFGWEDLVPAQAGAEERGGIEGTQTEYTGEFVMLEGSGALAGDGGSVLGTQSEYIQIASDGSPGFIWSVKPSPGAGGVAPFAGREAVIEGWGGLTSTQSEYIHKDWEDGWITFGTDFGPAPAGHLEGTPRRFVPGWACDSPDPVIHFIELSVPDMERAHSFWDQMVLSGVCKNFPTGLIFWVDEVVAELKWFDGDLTYVVKGHDTSGFVAYSWMPASKAKERGIPPPGTSELIPLI